MTTKQDEIILHGIQTEDKNEHPICPSPHSSEVANPQETQSSCHEESSHNICQDSAECSHFREICTAFGQYGRYALLEVARMERYLNCLSGLEKSLLVEDVDTRMNKIVLAIAENQNFLDLLISEQIDLSREIHEPNCSCVRQISESVYDGPENSDFNHAKESDMHTVIDDKIHNPTREVHPGEDNQKDHSQPQSRSASRRSSERAQSTGTDSPGRITGPIVVSETNISKVRSTLKQFARDWSNDGEKERIAAYGPLLSALERYMPVKPDQKSPRVLCPGSGLGRLPFEVVARNYSCQGNEFSYFMLLGSNFMLNHLLNEASCTIRPNCLNCSNRKGHNDHLLPVHIPDVCSADRIPAGADFSMCAGEFVEVYVHQTACWDAILTSFFIDTAKNPLLYIHCIANILRPGGLWANIGPLLYHYADCPAEMSVELSWEELRTVIVRYFTIIEEEWRDCYYTTNFDSMMQVLYHCIYFAAVRNENPVDPLFLKPNLTLGKSNSQ